MHRERVLLLNGIIMLFVVLVLIKKSSMHNAEILSIDVDQGEIKDNSASTFRKGASANYLGFEHIFILNLKRRPDRLERVTKLMDFFNLNYTVIEAIDTKNDKDIIQNFPYQPHFKYNQPAGSKAVRITHYNTFLKILEWDLQNALILEDDVDLDLSAGTLVPALVNRLLPRDWDVVALYVNPEYNRRAFAKVQKDKFVIQIKFLIGCVAYGVSRNAAIKIMENVKTSNLSWDAMIGEMIEQKMLKGFTTEPRLADHLGSTNFDQSDNKMIKTTGPYSTVLKNSWFEFARVNLGLDVNK